MSEANNALSTYSHEMMLDFTPEQIWPELCPVREYNWIESWECELVHSVSGYNELGCVFRTELPTEIEPETWVTSRFDVNERLEFIRSNSHRTIRFVIELEPTEHGTRMTWTHHVVPLTEEGREYFNGKQKAFDTAMELLERMLSHYLQTGKMLTGEDLGVIARIKSHVHGRKAG